MASNGYRTGDVISYMTMCSAIGVNLQRGMNFRLRDGYSVILMSLRSGAPYADRVEDEGRVLIYEGHVPKELKESMSCIRKLESRDATIGA